MDTLLMAVTALSVLMAASMAVVLARVLREERRRSDARVALLTELAGDRPSPADGVPLHAAPLMANDIFHIDSEPSPWPRRAAAIGGILLFVVFAALGWRLTAPSTGVERAATAPPAARQQPLELLSLRHTHAPGTLTITGLVQNPRSGVPLERVDATVLAFDTDGEMLASGRAPLDFLKLAPGDESPFVIRVPVEGAVARYRVGFRAADGSVLSHVDRRQGESLARKQDP